MKQNLSLPGFKQLVIGLSEFLNYAKHPSENTITGWYNALCGFTHEQVSKALDKMQNDLEIMPRNFPKLVIQYINQQPEEKTKTRLINYGACEGCNSSGGFVLLRKTDGKWYETIAFCSECRNWQNLTGIEGYNVAHVERQMLINKNIIFVEINRPISSWRKTKKTRDV